MNDRTENDIREVSYRYPVSYDDSTNAIAVHGVMLGPGYTPSSIDIMIEMPHDYPLTPPGVGAWSIYLPAELRFRGKHIKDLHPRSEHRFNRRWSWFCYTNIEWSVYDDTLLTLLGRIQADLDPAVQETTCFASTGPAHSGTGLIARIGEWLQSW